MIVSPKKEQSHWYYQDGRPAYDKNLRHARKENLLPSVTTVLKEVYPKPMLRRWQDEQLLIAAATTPRGPGESDKEWAEYVMKASQEKVVSSAEWGKDFHGIVESYCKVGAYQADESFIPYFEKYLEWHNENVIEVLGCEETVIQPTLGYAGRSDFRFRIKGKGVCLCDIKTRDVKDGKPLWYDEQPMQLVAYQFAMPHKPDHLFSMVINRLQPEAPYLKWYDQKELDIAWARWSAALELYKQIKQYFPKFLIGGGVE